MASNSFLKSVYRDSLSLLTDLYELTMAYGYWKNGLSQKVAVFQLFFRKYPFEGSFAICAGLETALDYIENFSFQEEDLQYLEGLKTLQGGPLFEKAFLTYLKELKFTLDIDAMEEGTPVFPCEPILQVKGPIIQAQLVESILLNCINFQTLIATKAARICYAAEGDQVVEFGLRRAQGIDGALSATRAAFIGGCHCTSNVLAGKLFGIPVMGTQAHSWIMAFEDEKEAFFKFAEAFPENCIFLIDTYDTLRGTKKAIEVAKELKKRKIEMRAVRLDSGDLAVLSKAVRVLLDEAGFSQTKIMASNELSEYIIADLKKQGAKIDIWGVGTHLVTGGQQPALDGVYKLSALQSETGKWEYKLKVSEAVIKTTNPGVCQVRRYFNERGYLADMLYDRELGAGDQVISHFDASHLWKVDKKASFKELLIPVLSKGKRVYKHPSLEEIRAKTFSELKQFHSSIRRFLYPQPFFAGIEKRLFEYKVRMISKVRQGAK